jgi:phosphoribosylformimino-5-aminoimidazole carboxamide ribonucleotide (ProFAR) isomerase
MRKFFNVLMVAAIALFAANCGGSSNTPAGIEKAIYSQLQKGNYEKAVTLYFDNLDGAKEYDSAEEKAEEIKAFAEKTQQSDEAKGGLKSFEIVNETISEDGLSTILETKAVYGDGSEQTKKSKYVNIDGVWKLSLGK